MIRRAFTLLEILVVVGIISILIAMGAVSYSTAQKKARDAKRNGDLHAAQNLMEQCYANNNYVYPIVTNSSGNLVTTCTAGTGTTLAFSITDPLNVLPNQYSVANSSSSSYQLSAQLESSTGSTVSVTNQQ